MEQRLSYKHHKTTSVAGSVSPAQPQASLAPSNPESTAARATLALALREPAPPPRCDQGQHRSPQQISASTTRPDNRLRQSGKHPGSKPLLTPGRQTMPHFALSRRQPRPATRALESSLPTCILARTCGRIISPQSKARHEAAHLPPSLTHITWKRR